MNFLHHPLFQSLALPLALGLGLGLLIRPASNRWLALAPSLALVLALLSWPGFAWPVLSRAQLLPWLVLGATAIAAAGMTLQKPKTTPRRGRAELWAALFLAVVGLALAAWGALGGSLLLAQLATTLSTVCAVGAWQAFRYRLASWAGLLPLLVFALGLALNLAWMPASGPTGPSDEDPYYSKGKSTAISTAELTLPIAGFLWRVEQFTSGDEKIY
jgi:hypothetical protein